MAVFLAARLMIGSGPPVLATPPAGPMVKEPDSDGDGLPDFQEIHKYGADPHKRDTAGSRGASGHVCPRVQDAQVVAYFLHIRVRKPASDQGHQSSVTPRNAAP